MLVLFTWNSQVNGINALAFLKQHLRLSNWPHQHLSWRDLFNATHVWPQHVRHIHGSIRILIQL